MHYLEKAQVKNSPPTSKKYVCKTCPINGCRSYTCTCLSQTVYSLKKNSCFAKKQIKFKQKARFHSELSHFSESKQSPFTTKSILESPRQPSVSSSRANKIKYSKGKDEGSLFSNTMISEFIEKKNQIQRQKQFMFPMPSVANQILAHKKARKASDESRKKSKSLDGYERPVNLKKRRNISISGCSFPIKDAFEKFALKGGAKIVISKFGLRNDNIQA